ncbi:MAG: helix-turn-helix transcriptional regulator [Prevotellaceae bacterium]|nr:helix-turn-helix transcriptional regulator [Prevotellaceae bacterium]
MAEKKTLAMNLKCLREATGFTQDRLAEYLGIGRSAYSNYESGDREAPLNILERLADLYGCELLALYEENENVRNVMFSTAFRVDNLSADDMEQLAAFKRVVKSYMKMDMLLKNQVG